LTYPKGGLYFRYEAFHARSCDVSYFDRFIVGGHVYADASVQELHTEKLDALIDLVEEQAGQPLLGWAQSP
jgi:hypothetical protein